MQRSDKQLALDSIQGDAGAFGILVERLRGPLIGYVTGLLRSRDDAEDIAQEAFLVAWQKIAGLREPDRVGGWIYRIAHNLAMKRGTEKRMLPLDKDLALADTSPGNDERMLRLSAEVARLSEPHREVIFRKHYAGATGEEIARQLGIPPGTVRSRLSRAYAELRILLQDDAESNSIGRGQGVGSRGVTR